MGWNKDGSFTLDGKGTWTGKNQYPTKEEIEKTKIKKEEEKPVKKK